MSGVAEVAYWVLVTVAAAVLVAVLGEIYGWWSRIAAVTAWVRLWRRHWRLLWAARTADWDSWLMRLCYLDGCRHGDDVAWLDEGRSDEPGGVR
ncbi:hypothetical protein Ade02nite_18940 [Paractinoplanes deccanensis]|uniref:Uncharacterized protein n=1 Tax=Paractinoplanes deccanensis TaxID=113561 RepID=A0ABQ3XZS4_9ACTN|nr:hypothetical protein [Actinoplanes deccanensis]GID73253.1 hypothetical protein Ade02nite_18940 [Actinoplanes deccanensis]